MKRIVFLVIFLWIGSLILAQNGEAIKTMLMLQQYQKAKDALDKEMANPRGAYKPESYLQKATVYSSLAMQVPAKGTATEDQLIAEADAAFKKYRETDPGLSLLDESLYQQTPVTIYSSIYAAGYKDYENKNWEPGFQKFKKVVEYSDLLIAKKIVNNPADTNALLLAGILAENAGMKEESVKYYARLADIRAGGEGFEGIYRFLVNFYITKKDNQKFEKYRSIGKELFPLSEFFNYDRVDFAIGLQNDLHKRLQGLEDIIAADPVNYKAILTLGELIYDTLDSQVGGAVLPSNSMELESKMINAFNKAAKLKPGDETPMIYMGDYFINKSITANAAKESFENDLKSHKPGTAISRTDQSWKTILTQQWLSLLERVREPYEKAAAILARKENLSLPDKQQYKKIVGYLGNIYMIKKNASKEKSAEQLKFATEEKKWNGIYEAMK